MKKLIWISSYPKSGNTWVRYFLSNYFYNREKTDFDFDILNKIDKFPPQKYLKEQVDKNELVKNAYNISKYWSPAQENITKTKDKFFMSFGSELKLIYNELKTAQKGKTV